MSQFAVEVVRVGPFTKNPNSDTLMMTDVLGHPVQFKEGAFQQGDLAAYVPVEAMVPLTGEFEFLKSPNHPDRTHDRIKAKRLRGVFSMGFLIPAPAGAAEGQDLAKDLGVYKYEEPEEQVVFEATPPTGLKRFFLKWRWKLLSWLGFKRTQAPKQIFPVYDIESVRKYQGLFNEGEEVVLTEKIHGCNARFGWYKRKFYVGSRTQYRNEGDTSYWSEAARELDLKDKLKPYPGIALYGEVFGSGVQDLEYGAPAGKRYLRVFDVLDIETRKWWDYDRAKAFVEGTLGLKMAPELYRGPWQGLEAHAPLGEGQTTLGWDAADRPKVRCIREGWVVKPVIERHDMRLGRVQAKYVGKGYLLRKDGTEKH